jgi:hypothetical protein
VSTIRKLSLTALIVGLVAGVAAVGAFSAYSETTSNTGNSFATGSVSIGDNDGSSAALYSSSGRKPGDSVVSCIRVTYTGSLASNVKLYASGLTLPANDTTFNLKVERGGQTTGSFPNCGDFAPTSAPYDGPLAAFPTSYATGLDGKAAAATWATNNTVDYRFTITVNNDGTAGAHTAVVSSGSHDFTWEAQNT